MTPKRRHHVVLASKWRYFAACVRRACTNTSEWRTCFVSCIREIGFVWHGIFLSKHDHLSWLRASCTACAIKLRVDENILEASPHRQVVGRSSKFFLYTIEQFQKLNELQPTFVMRIVGHSVMLITKKFTCRKSWHADVMGSSCTRWWYKWLAMIELMMAHRHKGLLWTFNLLCCLWHHFDPVSYTTHMWRCHAMGTLSAKSPGHQYPQCCPNIHYNGPVSIKYITITGNNIRKQINISWKNTLLFWG